MCLRLPEDDKKDVAKVKKELLTEFEKGQLNREEAIQELAKRSRAKENRPKHLHTYNIVELVKLACPSIKDNARGTIAKYYFVCVLHADMQIALKSNEKFLSTDIKALSTEVTRPEIAGVISYGDACGFTSKQVACVDDRSLVVNEITEKVLEKLRGASLDPLMYNCERGNAIINDVNLLNNHGENRGHFSSNRGHQVSNQGCRGDNRQCSRNRSSHQQQS